MINVVGPLLGTQGYTIHTKNLVNALSKITDVRVTTFVPPGAEAQLSDKEVSLIKKKPEKGETNLIITTPFNWRLSLGKRNWVYLVWEGDKIPKSFVEECLNPDIEYILVPSEHTKKAIFMTALSIDDGGATDLDLRGKVKVIPHGVNLDLFYPKPEDIPKPFTFLANKGFRNLEDRGGIQYLMKAYLEEFTPKDNVELLVKINPVYGVPDLNQVFSQLAPKNKKLPKVSVITDSYKYEDMVKLYHKGHVFVSPTRSDAFNIPCLEAMACGIPVLTTNFGGQTDFLNDDNGWLIDGELKKVEHEIMYEEIKWLTPDMDKLKQTMRHIYSNQNEIKVKGKKSLEKAKEFTWDITAQKIKDLANI